MIEIAAYRGYLAGHLSGAAALLEVALNDAKENLVRNPLDVPTETAVNDLEQALKLIRKQEAVVYPVDRKAAA
jgi:hypothetical protein